MTAVNAMLINAYAATPAPARAATAAPVESVGESPSLPDERDQFQPGLYWKNRAAAGAGRNAASTGDRAMQAYSSQDNPMTASTNSGEGRREGQAIGTGADSATEAAAGRQKGTGADSASRVTNPSGAKGPDGKTLDQRQVAQLLELKQTDTAVRAHEQAHLAAAGGLAKGGPSFVYQKGPDGREYAVGGEVQIDTSKGATPQETMARMAQVRAAALAPANPSAQDLKVARAASTTMSEASLELQAAMLNGRDQQNKGVGKISQQATGAVDTSSAVSPNQNKSAVTASAASRYLAIAKDAGVFHRMV